MMFFYSETKKKTFWTPPPRKKGLWYEWLQYGYIYMYFFIPIARKLDFYYVNIECFGGVKLQSNP